MHVVYIMQAVKMLGLRITLAYELSDFRVLTAHSVRINKLPSNMAA